MTQSKSKNDLVSIIINSKSINATLDNVEPLELRNDFRQHFYLQLLEISFEKLLEVHNRGKGSLEAFAGTIIRNQLKSNNSSFHKIYRKQHTQELQDVNDSIEVEYDHQIDSDYQKILLFLNHIHPKRAVWFREHYVNGKTIRQIAKQYKVNYRTINYSIRSTEEMIRKKLK